MNKVIWLVLALLIFLFGALCGMIDTEARLGTLYGCTKHEEGERFGQYVVIRPTAARWYFATVTPAAEEGR
jgi:hypothetical protein